MLTAFAVLGLFLLCFIIGATIAVVEHLINYRPSKRVHAINRRTW